MNDTTIMQEQEDFWLKWGWIWSFLYFFMLLVPLAIVILSNQAQGSELYWMIGLVVAGIGWHYWWTFAYPKRLPDGNFRSRPWMMFIHLGGIVISWYALVQLDAFFFFSLFGIFGLFFYFLPIVWAIVSALLFSGFVFFTSSQQDGGAFQWNDPTNLIFIMGSIGASFFAIWIEGIISQSRERQDLVEQLQQTRAELATAEHLSGQLKERQRLAQEIHDTLAQGFISIIMNLETADALLEESSQARRYVKLAAETARDNVAQARRVVDDLRPATLEQTASLPEAIQSVAERWQQESSTAVSLTVTGDPFPLPGNADVALLRAVQEGLANVRKHAQAKTVKITLSYMEDVVILDIQDDGNGVIKRDEAEGVVEGGYGLIAMQERIKQLNGSVLIESEPQQGTTLMVSIPIERGANE